MFGHLTPQLVVLLWKIETGGSLRDRSLLEGMNQQEQALRFDSLSPLLVPVFLTADAIGPASLTGFTRTESSNKSLLVRYWIITTRKVIDTFHFLVPSTNSTSPPIATVTEEAEQKEADGFWSVPGIVSMSL